MNKRIKKKTGYLVVYSRFDYSKQQAYGPD